MGPSRLVGKLQLDVLGEVCSAAGTGRMAHRASPSRKETLSLLYTRALRIPHPRRLAKDTTGKAVYQGVRRKLKFAGAERARSEKGLRFPFMPPATRRSSPANLSLRPGSGAIWLRHARRV